MKSVESPYSVPVGAGVGWAMPHRKPTARRPHTAETPLIRVTFKDPDGQDQQSTYMSTYRPDALKGSGSSAEDARDKNLLIDHIRRYYSLIDCELMTLEVVRSQTREIGL